MMTEIQQNEDCDFLLRHMDTFVLSAEDLECKICYSQYNLQSRRPKLLECSHSLCSKCLAKILDLDDALPKVAMCPFCRYTTTLQSNTVSELPDDRNLVAALTIQGQSQKNLQATTELLLNPRTLTSLVGNSSHLTPTLSSSSSSSTTFSSLRGPPSFVVITIMEPRPGRGPDLASAQHSSSLDSLTSLSQRWTLWSCGAQLCQSSARVLMWALGLLYFSSLPLGVYLLLLQRPTIGVLLVSLVPSSLALIMSYGLCQCLCQELQDCASTNNTNDFT